MNPAEPENAAGRQAESLKRPPSPRRGDRHWAWFLDVDGTLLEIEQHPDLVTADHGLLELLGRLDECYDGAVALISGRSLAQLDRIFGHRRIAAAASHGLELRANEDDIVLLGETLPAAIVDEISAFAKQHAGLLVERKSRSICVHFRAQPELADEVAARLEKLVAGLDNGFRLQHGKMMVELVPAAAGKGDAIRTFMERQPFQGRRPVFVGDDITDEHGFAAVNELGGLSVLIGAARETSARWRLDNVSRLRAWLGAAVEPP